MFALKKIQRLVILLSLLFLLPVKQTDIIEMPSVASNFNISNTSLTKNTCTEEEVGSCVFIIYIHLKINCTSCY